VLYSSLFCVTAFISAVASVANEWLYKDPDQKHANINQQNAWLYLWGTIFTAIFITATQGPSVFLPDNFFKGFSARVVIIIFVSIALGLSVSLILKHWYVPPPPCSAPAALCRYVAPMLVC